jgi:hypothetical protein
MRVAAGVGYLCGRVGDDCSTGSALSSINSAVHEVNIREDKSARWSTPPSKHEEHRRMSTAEFDARDVLDSYLGALNKIDHGRVCDVTELGYPKDLIKFVLRHCIKTIGEDDKQSFLRKAYLSLANFHELTDEERAAATLLSEIVASSATQSEDEKAARIRDAAAPLQGAIERYKAELAILGQELKALQDDDQ